MIATQQNTLPAWLAGITEKRGGEIAEVLFHLINHGIMHGKVTAEDAHCIPVSHPNVRGAAMKFLRTAGFEKVSLTVGSTDQSHAHWMFVWELKNYPLAKGIVNEMARPLQLIARQKQEVGQGQLL